MVPVRNEDWILDVFLRHHLDFFDAVIVADQMSTDTSRKIARQFKKVTLIDNVAKDFDEPYMRQLLLDEARSRFGVGNLLVALDADELLYPLDNLALALQAMESSRVGTRFWVNRVNLLPDLRLTWSVYGGVVGMVDDGSNFNPEGRIHASRIPLNSHHAAQLLPHGITQLHLQFIAWSRMEEKHKWYRRWEIAELGKSSIFVWRRYVHMHSLEASKLSTVHIPDSLRGRLKKAIAIGNSQSNWLDRKLKLERKIDYRTLRQLQDLETITENCDGATIEYRLLVKYARASLMWSNPANRFRFRIVRFIDRFIEFFL